MPTARQLLEQADALMRRNRKRGKGRSGGPPTLTDALGVDAPSALAPTIILPETPQAADPIMLSALPGPDAGTREATPAAAGPMALDTLADLPVLTDVVDTWEPAAVDNWPQVGGSDAELRSLNDSLEADALAAAPDAGAETAVAAGAEASGSDDVASPDDVDAAMTPREPSAHDATAAADAHPTVDAPETVDAPVTVDRSAPGAADPTRADASAVPLAAEAVVDAPPLLLQDEEFILDIPPQPLAESAPPSDTAVAPAPRLVAGSEEWAAMAEEIRMQVLQRLDLFTDTGMREQLGARLQPIVSRASAELVEAINQALGELVRGYVAEAIEREIDTWRKRGD